MIRRLKTNRHDSELNQELQRRLKNKVTRDIKSAKADYFQSKIEEHKNNSRKLWQHLKETGYSDKAREHSNIVLNIDNETCHEKPKIANHFNSFFTTIASTLAGNLPQAFKNTAQT